MILDATTKSVEIVLGAAATANHMPVTADYVDITTTTTVPGSSDTASNGTTPVTIVAAPSASTQRKVNYISIYNADTASKEVTVSFNNNATLRSMIVVTLQVGDSLIFTDTQGWQVTDANGNKKVTPFSGMTSAQFASLISDETGTGSLVFSDSPTLVTPALGTPASGTLDNCTTNTEAAGTNNTQLANTAHVYAERTNTATLTNKTLTGAKATTTIGVGNATPSASGAGITFPATQSASTDANTLDDYEEGTWTPALGDGTNNFTATSVGTYTKIGNLVTVSVIVTWTSIGSAGAGVLILTGLPFTTSFGVGGYGVCSIGTASGIDNGIGKQITGVLTTANTKIEFRVVNDNAAPTAIAANAQSATGYLVITASYPA